MTKVVAPGWREARIERMGKGPWKGVYSLVSLVRLILIVWGDYLARAPASYADRHDHLVGHTSLIGNVDLASILLFGSFPVWAAVDIVSGFRRPYTLPSEIV